MEGREKAKLKDSIVKFVMEDENREYLKGKYSLGSLYKSLENPTENINSFSIMLEEMAAEKPRCFKLIENHAMTKILYFKVTNHAKDIPDDKSFVAEYDAMSETIIKSNQAALRRTQIEELQFENLELSNKLSKQKLKTHWIPIIISGGSFLLAIMPYLTPSKNVTEQQLNPKIDSIQIRLQQLEKDMELVNMPIIIDTIKTTK